MTLDDIIIVICRPAESGNLGAVCRAMKNMGLQRLRVVAPEQPPDEVIIRARAIHAMEIWQTADHFLDLAAAISDCALVVGTTRRRGKKRKSFSLDPAVLAANLSQRPGPAAIVFGNERTGLSKSEMALCNLASHIPVNDDFPSLNLSHAVQIYSYEFHHHLAATSRPASVAVDRQQLDALVATISQSLTVLGFYKQAGREEQALFFRDIFARAGLTPSETKYLRGLFLKIQGLASQ